MGLAARLRFLGYPRPRQALKTGASGIPVPSANPGRRTPPAIGSLTRAGELHKDSRHFESFRDRSGATCR